MKSDIVVISWWSNCVGLLCLHRLVRFVRDRPIYVLQVGKTARQRQKFRRYIPQGVREIVPEGHISAEHGKVCAFVARHVLNGSPGIWFWDHDLFLLEDGTPWLQEMDRRLLEGNLALCYPFKIQGEPITNPAFWIAPGMLKSDAPKLSQVPQANSKFVDYPYRNFQKIPDLKLPEKDTLVAYKEYWEKREAAFAYALNEIDTQITGGSAFPLNEHMGGLYLLAFPVFPGILKDRVKQLLQDLQLLFQVCPASWIQDEDPMLKQRINSLICKIPFSNG